VIVGLAVSPDGKTMVATAQLTGKLLVFDLADPAKPKLTQRVATGEWPWLVTFTPDGAEVWVPNQRSNTVTVIDARRWNVITTVTANSPNRMASPLRAMGGSSSWQTTTPTT